jgi:outer membrane protein OmpA-like peptidoglycan-associated protein
MHFIIAGIMAVAISPLGIGSAVGQAGHRVGSLETIITAQAEPSHSSDQGRELREHKNKEVPEKQLPVQPKGVQQLPGEPKLVPHGAPAPKAAQQPPGQSPNGALQERQPGEAPRAPQHPTPAQSAPPQGGQQQPARPQHPQERPDGLRPERVQQPGQAPQPAQPHSVQQERTAPRDSQEHRRDQHQGSQNSLPLTAPQGRAQPGPTEQRRELETQQQRPQTPAPIPPAPQNSQQQSPAQPKGAQGPQTPQPATVQPIPPSPAQNSQQLPAQPKGAQGTQSTHPATLQPIPPSPAQNSQQSPAQPKGAQGVQSPQPLGSANDSPAGPQGAKPMGRGAPAGQPPAAAQQSPAAHQAPPVAQQPQVNPAPQSQQRQGAAPMGKIEDLRAQRKERVENNGQRTIIEEPDHRVIVRENGQAIIRHDETERFRQTGANVRVEQRAGETVTIVRRPGDVDIVTVVDANGRLLRRVRRTADGREFVLIDNRPRSGFGIEAIVVLPPPRITIPREQYVVELEEAPPQTIIQALEAPPVERLERAYSLDEIRYSLQVRDRMRRIDLDTINFDTGSWQVTDDQAPRLEVIAGAINAVIRRNPNETFLIEGHTDAVGADEDNLSLSDRRADAIAVVLTQSFQVPPENLTTQGYGAHELKVPTQGPSRENRRVTIRRITPLLAGAR